MDKIAVGLASVFLGFVAQADAQSVPGRVTGAVGAVGSVAGGATAGVSGLGGSPGGSLANPTNGSLTGSQAGGNLPGALNFKAGDRIIQFRGAAGVGDDRGNVKAGLGIPF